jgi:4-hydroxy-4-methyl-2-oxoglutarate aldolase
LNDPTTQDDAVRRATRLGTARLSDALDRCGIAGQCRGLLPRGAAMRAAGRAFTVQYRPADETAGTVGDYIDDVAPGSVIVLDAGAREDATVWGDILTEIAYRRGIAGTVIDGVCRDVDLCLELNYPLFSRGQWMRTGRGRLQMQAVAVAVQVGSVRIAPGDLVRGDADGVIAIPRESEALVLAAAEEIERAENALRAAVRGGMRLDEARRRFGYHQLFGKAPRR